MVCLDGGPCGGVQAVTKYAVAQEQAQVTASLAAIVLVAGYEQRDQLTPAGIAFHKFEEAASNRYFTGESLSAVQQWAFAVRQNDSGSVYPDATAQMVQDTIVGAAAAPVANMAASGVRALFESGADAGFGSLSRAAEFGIKPYSGLQTDLQGLGLQAHHLLPQRFAAILGMDVKEMASVAVTKAEHQIFTNAWRAAIPYGAGTANATVAEVMSNAQEIYADYPAILNELGLGSGS